MTEREFVYALRRGLGSAIVFLKASEDKLEYRDAVLRCCLRDIAYNSQDEGLKGEYLYFAIEILGEQEKHSFEQAIAEKFLTRCNDRLFDQLLSVLSCYADDGSAIAMRPRTGD